MIAQAETAINAAAKVVEGRSETFAILVIFVALMVWREFRDWKSSTDAKTHERTTATANSASLALIGQSTETTGTATKSIAKTIENMEQRQERDRRAILAVIDSLDARASGDDERAKQALRDARSILIAGG